MFHDLGRQLDKIAGYARHTVIMDILEEIMQAMAKFMEQCFRFVGTQQGRLSFRRLGKVAYDRNNRSQPLAILIGLRAIGSAPGSPPFACTRKEIEIQDS